MARTFEDMPTLGTRSPTRSPPFYQRRRSWARKVERCCCRTATHFPLVIVYGLTTWAVWVEVMVSLLGQPWLGYLKAGLGMALWILANVSYSTAVFTNPGSPLDPREDLSRKRTRRRGYEGLPTEADEAQQDDTLSVPNGMTMVTAKSSSGEPRFCKKCRCIKPDRSHHCSTCGRCVLKMDHHCPWLATCVGLRNYKPFFLFLLYTSLFCWLCFGVSAAWVWRGIMDDTQMQEGLLVVNTILLAVLGGIVGLVLSCFTGWHFYLVVTGHTTIESLEKTRYLSPLRKSIQQGLQPNRNYIGLESSNDDQALADRLKEIHANALPGILRPEEGEAESLSRTPSPSNPSSDPSSSPYPNSSPAKSSLQRTYANLEAQREHTRYAAYLDERDSERLPNAFDQGWKCNLQHVFGDRPALWLLPVCNTSGDGWQWEISPKWLEARAEAARQRTRRAREEDDSRRYDGQYPRPATSATPPSKREMRWQPGQGFVDEAGSAAAVAAPPLQSHSDGARSEVRMQPLDHWGGKQQPGEYDAEENGTSSDDDVKRMYSHVGIQGHVSEGIGGTGNWNDVPEEFSPPGRFRRAGERSRSRGRRKGD